ncbi:hypothetical protein DEIGR_400135 [Deinococcus grandis]|uniref:Uncharacterized protein n=1 Tax=Deinococcus grandis TaxID=57498 RepID=A0A124BSD3_9DEIO|nr:hypothetical protein [Deinococcus grandis]GAQ24002.1 hypothetical protein DEIGR_400135 [Deinococcus grandis]
MELPTLLIVALIASIHLNAVLIVAVITVRAQRRELLSRKLTLHQQVTVDLLRSTVGKYGPQALEPGNVHAAQQAATLVLQAQRDPA